MACVKQKWNNDDASGKLTGGTVTFSDKATAAITVTTATA